MADYIYLPVPTEEMTKLARWASKAMNIPRRHILRNKYLSGHWKAFHRHFGERCLSRVGPWDTLYILAHGEGYAGSNLVGAKRGSKFKTYTPEKLTSTLKKEGLADNVTDIRLLACGGGLEVQGIHDSWAQKLKRAMNDAGYWRVYVTGYRGFVQICPWAINVTLPEEGKMALGLPMCAREVTF